MIGQKSTERNIYFSGETSQEVKNEIKNLQNQITTIDGEIDDINSKLQGAKEPDGSTVWVSSEDKLTACGSKTTNGGVMFSNADLNTDLSNNSITNGNNIHLESNNSSNLIANGYIISIEANSNSNRTILNGSNISTRYDLTGSLITGDNIKMGNTRQSIIVGYDIDTHTVNTSGCGIIGNKLTLNSNLYYGLLIGHFNADIDSDDVFIVANGTSANNKNNMITCKNNGNIVLSKANIYNTSNQLLTHILDTGIGLSPINSNITINYQNGVNFDTNLVLLVANVTLTVTDTLASGTELLGLIGTTKQFGAFTKTYLCNNVDQKIVMNWDTSSSRFKLGTNLTSGTYEFDIMILQPLY